MRSRHLAAKIAARHRHHGPDDPRLGELRAELTEERIREWVERQLADAPPLSQAARDRLAALLGCAGHGTCAQADHVDLA